MSGQNRHKWLKECNFSKHKIAVVKILYLLACLTMLFFIFSQKKKSAEASAPSSADMVEVVFEEQTPEEEQELKISFEEYCRRNPISLCWDNSQTTDFMYAAEDAQTAVIKTEEFSAEILEEAMRPSVSQEVRRLAEEIKIEAAQPLSAQKISGNAELFAQIELLNQDILDRIYEEELPDNIIFPRTVVNPKLKGKTIIPGHKPPYFGEKPVIVIVIDDMGISKRRTADIASLQAPLTASFLTYGTNLEQQIENSRRNGQEIIIHVPMEAQKNIDVAPDVLTTRMSPLEIQNKLRHMLAKFKNARGINNHMGSKLTEDKERMTAVMEVLKEKNMFFLDSKTSAQSKAEDAAAECGIAYAHRHVFIDNNNDKVYILGQLAKAENVARKNGYAIAIGHPKTQTFEALKEWLPQLEEKGILLKPLSEVIQILNPEFK